MKKDYLGLIINKLRHYRIELLQVLATLIMKPIIKLKGISLMKGIKCYGLPIIVRSPYSTFIIGKKLRVRSDRSSNLFGTFKRCTIAAVGRHANLVIGDNCGFTSASITSFNQINIGNNVIVGANAIITDSDWHSLSPANRSDNVRNSPIHIEDNVWIGANSIVLKGVTIGQNTVIGAGSIVVKSIPANVIAAGNPCKVIRKLKYEN